jgi:HB1, ASXL, restriction endonuclease HTH domain
MGLLFSHRRVSTLGSGAKAANKSERGAFSLSSDDSTLSLAKQRLEPVGPSVDAYLDIALTVLRATRRPLSARAILASAYKRGLVPPRLYGKTQHKTLQARISEDIVLLKERSAFFRSEPGRFFLREFLADTSLPEEFRRPIPTRRRIRELRPSPALTIGQPYLEAVAGTNAAIEPKIVCRLLQSDRSKYEDVRRKLPNSVFVRSFVCVRRSVEVLTYRLGRYRDDRDSFLSKRSIGFSTLVHIDHDTLFTNQDRGVVDAGIRATLVDLDIPDVEPLSAALSFFVWAQIPPEANDLLAVTMLECPGWFEPTKRRLALNDLRWMNWATPVNNLDDFDPWSRTVLWASYVAKAGPHVGSALKGSFASR